MTTRWNHRWDRRRRYRSTRRWNWFVVPALVLAACGGGDDGERGASDGDWCALAQQIEDADQDFDGFLGNDPGEVERAVGELQGLLDQAARVAPDEILADVNTSVDGVDLLANVLEDADYDVTRIDEQAVSRLDAMGDEMDTATARIEAYNEDECGIVPSDDAADDPDDGDGDGEDDGGVFTGDVDSEWCVAARDVEAASDRLDADDFDFTDPAAVESAFGDMLSAFEAATAVAPSEISREVRISYEGFLQLRDALAEVEYDFLLADLAVIDELDEQMEDASAIIEDYNEAVCGILADDDGDGDDDDGGSEFDPSAGSIRDQTIAELVAQGFTAEEAGCIFDGIDLTDPDLGADNSIIIQVFDECGIDLARLAELGG